MDTQDKRIPVTLLTGFLGAGKTTLLNHLINDPEAGRIAVIMNEFGAAGLDHDLIEASTEETILMQSGCLCCTFRGDIAKLGEYVRALPGQGLDQLCAGVGAASGARGNYRDRFAIQLSGTDYPIKSVF